jgi:plastocyanin
VENRGLRRIACVLAMLALGGAAAIAQAASLAVTVTRPGGEPVASAVIQLHGPPALNAPAPETAVVDQVNQAFTPDLTIMPVGSSVTFPNSDKVSHQVYSFSPARRFQLPLYRGTPYAPIRFDAPGIITLGCNIHDDMIAYLVVSDAARFGRTDAQGVWKTDDLPAGEYRVRIWHPRMREAGGMIERVITLDAPQSATLVVQLTRPLRPEPLGRKPRSWSDY